MDMTLETIGETENIDGKSELLVFGCENKDGIVFTLRIKGNMEQIEYFKDEKGLLKIGDFLDVKLEKTKQLKLNK
jgi:hypothetical protein